MSGEGRGGLDFPVSLFWAGGTRTRWWIGGTSEVLLWPAQPGGEECLSPTLGHTIR